MSTIAYRWNFFGHVMTILMGLFFLGRGLFTEELMSQKDDETAAQFEDRKKKAKNSIWIGGLLIAGGLLWGAIIGLKKDKLV